MKAEIGVEIERVYLKYTGHLLSLEYLIDIFKDNGMLLLPAQELGELIEKWREDTDNVYAGGKADGIQDCIAQLKSLLEKYGGE